MINGEGKCNLRCHLIFVVHQESLLDKIQLLHKKKGGNLTKRPINELHQFAAMQWILIIMKPRNRSI